MKLNYITKNLIWGGTKLNKLFGKISQSNTIAESWELTVRDDGMSKILNGIYKGMELGDFCDMDRKSSLGNLSSGCNFPLLIKYIDAEKDLSIQVHPDNEYARLTENDSGKTEMWYIIDAEKDAKIVYGLKNGFTIKDLNHNPESAGQIFNYINVSPGDVFFIPPGLIHSVGKGIFLAEIQQNSNITYRIYDYDRIYKGKKRELHIAKATDCARSYTEEEIMSLRFSAKDRIEDASLCECDWFSVKKIDLNESDELTLYIGCDSFASLIVIDAKENSVLKFKDNEYKLGGGDSYFIPAGTGNVTLRNSVLALYTRI